MTENSKLSKRGKKFLDHFPIVSSTGEYDAHTTLHYSNEIDVMVKDLRKKFKRNGMKSTPHLSNFMVCASKTVADTFWDDGERLGMNPADYTLDRLKNMCVVVRKVDTNTEAIVKMRDNTVKQIDNKYTRKLQAMVASK